MKISLIQVPYHAGDDRHAASEGPQRLLDAGVVDLLHAQGHRVTVESVDRKGPFRDTASSSAAVNKEVARLVRTAVAAGRLPLVVAGSCVACHGVLAGFEHSRCGAVWLDAHADFNTPDSAASGFFPGMALAVATGHCFANYWGEIGDNTPLREDNVVMFGVRDLWPEGERQRVDASDLHIVPWRDGRPAGDVVTALAQLAERVGETYLHIDFDAFAPDVAPGVVDEPVPGGLSAEDGEAIIDATAERFRIRAVTLATYTPANDRAQKTLELALRLVQGIGEMANDRAGAAEAGAGSPRGGGRWGESRRRPGSSRHP